MTNFIQNAQRVFNNIFLALNVREIKRLKDYIDKLEIDYWEHKYQYSDLKRKIPLPATQENLVMMFNKQEIIGLRNLLSFNKQKETLDPHLLNVDGIDYVLHLN